MLINIFSVISALALCALIFFLIYKGKLKEQYSILWILLSLVILFFSVFRSTLDDLADIFGIHYAPSLLFIFAFLTMLLLLIQLSVVISGLKDQVKKLSQEIGVLKNKKRNDTHGESAEESN